MYDEEATMKPSVYVTRRLPQPALQQLLQVCDVEIWDGTPHHL